MELLIEDLKKVLPVLAAILVTAYLFSLGAEYYWAFDLFSHFKIQYAVGGLIMFPLMMCLRQYYYAPFVLLIGLLSIWDINRAYEPAENVAANAQKIITIAQYNKLFRNQKYPQIRKWLEENREQIDIIFVQESGVPTITDLKQFSDIYPYQFPEGKEQRTNDVSVLSKTPINVSSVFLTTEENRDLYATKITFKAHNENRPIHLYSFHTIIPMNGTMQQQRNKELDTLSTIIAADDSPYIIASGDWNITPYSPFFQKFKDVSGLKQPAQGYFPDVTWPSTFLLPFLKIPIDQILHSDGLQLIEQHVGPSMGSDHHSLIASFAISDSK